MVRKIITDMERFERNIVRLSCGCWVSIRHNGLRGAHGHTYARWSIGSRSDGSRRVVAMHRWIYEQTRGPIPKGMLVCHTCDIPECVNPAHLWLGTVKQNVDDMRAKGRDNYTGPKKPNCGPHPWTAKLDAVRVRKMRRLFATGKWTKKALAEKFGVHRVTVIGILRGDFWKHV
jgi:hypothetical protein